MTKQEFKQFTEDYPIFLDGATGSCLQKRGMPFGVCPEKWITENEEVLIQLQKEYADAGSQIVYAPTFGGNSIKLKEYGLENEAYQLNKKLVEISKKAVGDNVFVAGDITMCGQTLEPLGDLPFETLVDSYEEQIRAFDDAGADLIIVETMMSLQETRAALIAARNVSELPVMATMTFGENGRTLYGTDIKTAAIVLEKLGADAIGVNCSAGPDKVVAWVEQIKAVSNLPIIAKPNAGMPSLGANGETVYDMGPSEFAKYMELVFKAGASLLGGCCGTSPEYIKKIKEVISKEVTTCKREIPTFITSEREYIEVDDIRFCNIDTRENEDVKEEIEEDEYDTIYDLLDEMEDEEQNAVCICIDGNDNKQEIVVKVIEEVTGYTTSPICFETDYEDVLECALRNYCGVAAVKETEKNFAFVNKIADKYGAYVIK